MAKDIRTVAVVGCGVIGMSWASLFLANGLRVIISDPVDGIEERFESYLAAAWPSLEQAGLAQEDKARNYEFVPDLTSKLHEADFVQENGPESLEFKEDLMKKLDEHARSEVVIASSSSGLPSSSFIGKCENHPERILVGHPFNPPHLIPLVEVVPHSRTEDSAIEVALNFYRSMGKQPILLKQEVPGFVANRLQAAINSEAYSLISRGIVSAEDLDTAVQSGPGLRWALSGPITINALGGGGGTVGFNNRLARLGPAIRSWEKDMADHKFDWSDESVKILKSKAQVWLDKIDWSKVSNERDGMLLELLATKGPPK